jgi:hypothetical protein
VAGRGVGLGAGFGVGAGFGTGVGGGGAGSGTGCVSVGGSVSVNGAAPAAAPFGAANPAVTNPATSRAGAATITTAVRRSSNPISQTFPKALPQFRTAE